MVRAQTRSLARDSSAFVAGEHVLSKLQNAVTVAAAILSRRSSNSDNREVSPAESQRFAWPLRLFSSKAGLLVFASVLHR
jgi:hypothetical protein